MSKATDIGKDLQALIDSKLAGAPTTVSADLPDQDDPLAVLVQSFLMWESTTEKAAAAYGKLLKGSVDMNDLRVSMAHEMVASIGARYPQADERCRRLRATLRAVYLREHEMSLKSAVEMTKRNVRKYVESLDGILPYVAERVLLLGFGAHAMPVDEPLRSRLVEAKVIEADVTCEDASALLCRHVKAADALAVHLAFQSWIDAVGAAPAKSSRAAGSKKSTKAKTTKTKTKTKKKTAKTTPKPAAKSPSKTTSKSTTTKKTTAASKKTTKRTTKKTSSSGTTTKKKTTTKSTSSRTASSGASKSTSSRSRTAAASGKRR